MHESAREIKAIPAALLAILLLLALVGVAQSPVALIAGAALALGLWRASGWMSRNWSAIDWLRGGRALLALSVLMTFSWAFWFDSAQYSDFGIYFRCGSNHGTAMAEWVSRCQSGYLRNNLIFWSRSFPYTTLLFTLVGESYLWLKLFNAMLQSACLLALYGLATKVGPPQFAFWALALYVINPERVFSLTLATPDHVALLALVGLLALFQTKPLGAARLWHAAATGMLVWLLDVSRSLGPVALIAMMAWVAFGATTPGCLAPRLKTTASAMIAYGAIGAIWHTHLNASGVLPVVPTNSGGLLRHLSGLDFRGEQLYNSNYAWVEHAWQAIPTEYRVPIALRKIWTELSLGLWEWPAYFVRKADIFFAGDGYYGFSSYNHVPPGLDSEMTVAQSTIRHSNRSGNASTAGRIPATRQLGLCV
jgi:hypothetical protein